MRKTERVKELFSYWNLNISSTQQTSELWDDTVKSKGPQVFPQLCGVEKPGNLCLRTVFDYKF